MTDALHGQLGVVLAFDADTSRRVERVAQAFPDADFVAGDPHVTLYHAPLAGLPEEQVGALLDELAGMVREPLVFDRVGTWGGRFVFWDARVTPELAAAHRRALALARWLDRPAVERADVEGLTPSERAAVAAYGYPLAGDGFRPHLTLAWFAQPLGDRPLPEPDPWTAAPTSVALGRIGEHGRLLSRVAERSLAR